MEHLIYTSSFFFWGGGGDKKIKLLISCFLSNNIHIEVHITRNDSDNNIGGGAQEMIMSKKEQKKHA